MVNSAGPTIDVIAGSRDRIAAVCARLDAQGWHRPTPLPGWDVQDVVAHLASLEAMLLGRPEPDHRAADLTHVRNPLGELNEHLVDRRRSWPGPAVLEEFRETTEARLEELRGLDEQALDREVTAPSGRMVPLRDFLGTRVWDYFVHELDIAQALGTQLPLQTPAAERVLGEILLLVPRAAAKAGASDGSVIVIEVGDPMSRTAAVRVEGGRGTALDPPAAGEATLHLRASPAAFLLVVTGRHQSSAAIADGAIEVIGDTQLAERVLAHLNVVP
jgi:uncharacterized protein (TIGR03083 family)